MDNHVHRMMSHGGVASHRSHGPLPNDDVRAVWSFVLEKITRQGGPFGGVDKTEKFGHATTLTL